MSLARSTVEVVGDLSAAELPAVTVASRSASAGFNDRIRPYAMSETGRKRPSAEITMGLPSLNKGAIHGNDIDDQWACYPVEQGVCDLVGLRVHDVVQFSHVATRAIVMQKKAQRPVQFEITEHTRDAVTAWIAAAYLKSEQFLFPSRALASPNLSTRQYPRIVGAWAGSIGLDPAAESASSGHTNEPLRAAVRQCCRPLANRHAACKRRQFLRKVCRAARDTL